MREYWERHASVRARVDWETDPEGLANVCYVNAPAWLNRQHAALQRRTFDALLELVPRSGRALDVGCGTARWTRRLMDHGLTVTGIDLQEELLERNRAQLPEATFVRASVQDFDAAERFDVFSSVTVIQHMPYAEQEKAVANLARLAAPGATALLLENIRDRAAHVFARSVEGWAELFARHGFTLVAQRPYDFSPLSRTLAGLVAAVRRTPAASNGDGEVAGYNRGGGGSGGGRLGAVRELPRRLAQSGDAALETALGNRPRRATPVHAGMVFRRLGT